MALDETSFDFEEGQLISFLGPSGCGKTTLLRIIAGLIPKTSGAVTIGNLDVDGPVGNYGFVFQSPSLMPWRSVLDNVMFPIEILRQRDSSARQRANELLELVGLSAFTESRPHQLSGGMQQRVALCRALVHRPKLLLMDEPFGALDELTRLEMNDLLLRIRQETGATVLFVTHSITEAIYVSDKVLVQYVKALDPQIVVEEINILRRVALSDDVAKHGYGYVSPERMKATVDFINKNIDVAGEKLAASSGLSRVYFHPRRDARTNFLTMSGFAFRKSSWTPMELA